MLNAEFGMIGFYPFRILHSSFLFLSFPEYCNNFDDKAR